MGARGRADEVRDGVEVEGANRSGILRWHHVHRSDGMSLHR